MLCGLIKAQAGVLNTVALVDQDFFKKRAVFIQRTKGNGNRANNTVTDQFAFAIALIFPLRVIADPD